jgi:hypothetical protein
MQHGCMERLNRKRGPEVWQFRWSVTGPDAKRLYHKKIVGTVERYADENAARRAIVGLVLEINTDGRATNCGPMTVAQLCDHFEQRELAMENTWRSHATKKVYKAYLSRWIPRPSGDSQQFQPSGSPASTIPDVHVCLYRRPPSLEAVWRDLQGFLSACSRS